MNVLLALSLWFPLIMTSCCGNVNSSETEVNTEYYDYPTVTMTPDYDYNATFDYYYVTAVYGVSNQASAIGRLTPVLPLGLAVLHIWH